MTETQLAGVSPPNPESALPAVDLGQYRFAATQLGPGSLLDICCGNGVGTLLLKNECSQVKNALGVDPSPDAIAFAKSMELPEGVAFLAANPTKFWDTNGYANIVSLGTLQFLDDPGVFVQRMSALLRTGGIFIVSAPVTPSMDGHPNHRTDFTEASLRLICRTADLEEVQAYEQTQGFDPRLLAGNAAAPGEKPGLLSFYKKYPDKLLSRIGSTLRHGFQNKYLTIAWKKPY